MAVGSGRKMAGWTRPSGGRLAKEWDGLEKDRWVLFYVYQGRRLLSHGHLVCQ